MGYQRILSDAFPPPIPRPIKRDSIQLSDIGRKSLRHKDLHFFTILRWTPIARAVRLW